MRDDMISQLITRLKDIERQLHDLQRLDVAPQTAFPVAYSGTPVAGQLGQWTGAGTLTHSGYAGSAVARYSGVPTAGAITYWTGSGTVAHAGYGTADVARYAGTPSANNMTHWTAAGTVAAAGFGTADVALYAGTAAFTTEQTFNQRVTARDFRQSSISVLDDNASLLAAADIPERGLLFVHTGQAAEYSMVLYRRTSTVFATDLMSGADMDVTTTTVLAGTTGTDGKVTISVTTAGIYVENRRGSSRSFNSVILAGFN